MHVLFDFDGVFVDSGSHLFEVSKMNIPGLSREAWLDMYNGNIYDASDEHGATNKGYIADEQDSFFGPYQKFVYDLPMVDGFEDMLSALHEKYTIAVISSCMSSIIDRYATKHGIRDNFDSIWGVDVDRDKAKKIKMYIERKGAKPEECLLVTDTLGDVREATKAGIDVIAVTWGFHERERLEKGEPHAIVDRATDILDVVENYFKS